MLCMIYNAGFPIYYKISDLPSYVLVYSSVQWLEKKSKAFEPTYLYTMEKVRLPCLFIFCWGWWYLSCLGGLFVYFGVCVGLSCRVTSYCLKEPGLGTTYVRLTLAYQLGIPALGTGYVYISAENSIISWFTLLTSLASSKLLVFSRFTQTVLKTSELSRYHVINFNKLCLNGNLIY